MGSDERTPGGSCFLEGRGRCYVHPTWKLVQPVFLVGFMGAGKTSLARRLARTCGATSIDLDRYIERSVDMRIPDIFENEGEDAFRQLETQALCELAERDPAFISCGGGIVEREENRELLRTAGFTLYLKVSVDEAKERISNIATRPVFQDMDEARRRSRTREPMYEAVAHARIDTAGARPGELVHDICRILRKAGAIERAE